MHLLALPPPRKVFMQYLTPKQDLTWPISTGINSSRALLLTVFEMY